MNRYKPKERKDYLKRKKLHIFKSPSQAAGFAVKDGKYCILCMKQYFSLDVPGRYNELSDYFFTKENTNA